MGVRIRKRQRCWRKARVCLKLLGAVALIHEGPALGVELPPGRIGRHTRSPSFVGCGPGSPGPLLIARRDPTGGAPRAASSPPPAGALPSRHPLEHRGAPEADRAAERDRRQSARARLAADPAHRHRQELGDLLGCQKSRAIDDLGGRRRSPQPPLTSPGGPRCPQSVTQALGCHARVGVHRAVGEVDAGEPAREPFLEAADAQMAVERPQTHAAQT